MSNKELPVIALNVNGVEYVFDVAKMKWHHEQKLYEQSKLTLAGIMNAVSSGNVALYMIAGIVFMARLQAGHHVKFSDIADAIDFESEIEMIETEVDDALPKDLAS